MFYYTIYDLTIASELEFMQLRTCEPLKLTDIIIKENGIPEEIFSKIEYQKYDIGLKESWLSNKTATFYVKDGCEIRYMEKAGARKSYLQSFILGFVMAMLLQQRNIMAIHCSAVSDGEKAFLLAGESGAGKSTLAEHFLSAGYKLMADDVVAVSTTEKKEAVAHSAFPYQKLCRNVIEERNMDKQAMIYIDEDKDKYLVPIREKFEFDHKKIKAMFFLCPCECNELEIKELSGIKKLMAFQQNMFLRKLPGEWQKQPEILKMALQYASIMPIYLVLRPLEGMYSEQIMNKIVEIIN